MNVCGQACSGQWAKKCEQAVNDIIYVVIIVIGFYYIKKKTLFVIIIVIYKFIMSILEISVIHVSFIDDDR